METPSLTESSDDEEYVVEAIRDWRHNMRENQREYLIKWHHYDESDNTWEPEEHLNCPDILEEFKKQLPKKQKKIFNAPNPGSLSGFQRRAKFQRCIGADGPRESDDEDTPKADKQKFYCLLLFEDSDFAEEVSLKDFYRYQPEEAFAFCESRLFSKGNSSKEYR